MRSRLTILVLVGALVVAACGPGEDPAPDIVLDGTPRHADDQGVVTKISLESLTLDGERTYPVSSKLKAFSTVTLELEPMLSRDGQYVLVGVADGKVVWMAGVAQVVPGTPRRAFYTGTLEQVGDGRLVFRDGTVLDLADGYRPPVEEGAVVVEIDVDKRRVIRVRPS